MTIIETPIKRPDVEATLAGLKDFQRNTVELVHSRFFDRSDPTRRFLVADEVGLGKTLVARGVTARLVDELWNDVDRIDVVYICSNAAIASQNIRKLQIEGGTGFTRATRLTLLPRTIHDLQKRKLNFISLTPGTSFSRHSATGTSEERALLYLMLREAWDLGDRMAPINVFCHQRNRDGFIGDIRQIESDSEIDSQLKEGFLENVARTSLREHFESTRDFFQRRQWDRAPEEGRRAQHRLIDQLRRVLAKSCVDALEPDLVILDEFQRFQHLLEVDESGHPTSDAGELAHQLFGYKDELTGEHARTLLLSATPYTAFGVDSEDPDSSHHKSFTETVSFLLDDRGKVDELQRLFRDQRDLMLGQASARTGEEPAGDEIREILLKVMCRTERLGATTNRDGMLGQIDHEDQDLEAEDILGYLAVQDIGRNLNVADLIEFWKSSPYLLNMMDGYKFNRVLSDCIELGEADEFSDSLRDGSPGVLDRGTIERLEKIDPGNARLRELWREIEEAGASRLLWLNPSMPYYRPSGPFAHPGADRFTKRLVFSNWMVVPKAISSVLSYLVEQELFEAGGRGSHSYSDQARTAGSLKTLFRNQRVSPPFALVYPSRELASAGDPLRFVTGPDGQMDSTEISRRLADELKDRLAGLETGSHAAGPVDQAWYWAAPILLDFEADDEGTRQFIQAMSNHDPAFRGDEEPDEGDGTDTQWARCLKAAEELLDDNSGLGAQPDDLPEVMARLALGGFGNNAFRALARNSTPGPRQSSMGNRIGGLRIGLAIRALFNLPHATHLLRSLRTGNLGSGDALWRECLEYCISGNLQATLDEFAHLALEQLGVGSEEDEGSVTEAIADQMTEAIGLRTTTASAGFFDVDGNGNIESQSKNLRTRFAIPFIKGQSDDRNEVERVEHVRAAFNSPFWPFMLTSTSVGQEGLDFHLYCHAIVHWNLPSNPVDLEQREGRVHRYKNHAVRRNLASTFGETVLRNSQHSFEADVWEELFKLGVENRPENQTELWPFWIFTPDGQASGSEPSLIERHVMAMSLSRDEARLGSLLRSLVLYRSVLGQPRQEDLVKALEKTHIKDLEAFSERTRIDLSPPAKVARTQPAAGGLEIVQPSRTSTSSDNSGQTDRIV